MPALQRVRIARSAHPVQYYAAVVEQAGIQPTAKNRKITLDVIEWLSKKEATGGLPRMPAAALNGDETIRTSYAKKVMQQYFQEKYGSIWVIIGFAVFKALVMLLIQSFLFGESPDV